MKRFFLHIVKVAAGLGLILGILAFSFLLYISDFGGSSDGPASDAPMAVGQEAAPPADPRTPGQRWLQWVFGTPEKPPESPQS